MQEKKLHGIDTTVCESVRKQAKSSAGVRIDGPRGGGELGLFQISKTIKATLTYAMLVSLNSPTG